MKKVWEWLKDVPGRRELVLLLVVVNFLGSIYGYYWYRNQLAATPPVYWPVIPDSPLATTLMVIALLLWLKGNRSNILLLLGFVVVIKYGLWAVAVITHYWLISSRIGAETAMLWFSHLGMALEGCLFLRWSRFSYRQILIVAGWLLFNDYVDYFWGLHPYLYDSSQISLARSLALLLSLAIVTGLALWASPKYSAETLEK